MDEKQFDVAFAKGLNKCRSTREYAAIVAANMFPKQEMMAAEMADIVYEIARSERGFSTEPSVN